ncbi:TMV resistance protein N [Morella rubra]|uniref:TMV resistance protein N n=1 Tax=Morella rubra TaxID=262757 RepID=A0A6A1UID2_9ROSI|nr:TMV resistance protein N [Morella rubra]
MVLPIFYDVDPSEVRKLEGSFGEALTMHEEKFNDNMETVRRWKGALQEVASLSGWHLSNRHEPEFIQTIVKEISNHSNRTFLNVAKHPVGLDSHIHAVSTLLSLGCDDVGMIGVHGIGGIGKTTIAKAVYNLIANQFEVSSFLANIREISEQYGLVQLQERLLYEISGDSDLKLGNVDRGIMVIRDRLCNKKVLLVLDDVDNLKQLEKLAGDKKWFGPGSRVIITTRDQHILVAHGVETIYKVPKLSHDDALQLFSWNAFKKSFPAKDYEDFANSAVRYAKGLPLALVVLGSFLYGRKESEWESTICRLEKSLNKEVYEILKISFDGLEDHEKAIFLDIACFFTGDDSDYVTKILQGCDFHPVIGIAVLIEKSLLSIEKNKLQMHSLLQLMGRHIVHQESPELGKRSRLWFHDDVLRVLTERD